MRWFVVAFILAIIIGGYFGYHQQLAISKLNQQNDSLATANMSIGKDLEKEKMHYAELKLVADSNAAELKVKIYNLALIKKKYDKIRGVYRNLPANDSFLILTGYLAKADSTYK